MRATISCVMSTAGGRLGFIDKLCPLAHGGVVLFASERGRRRKREGWGDDPEGRPEPEAPGLCRRRRNYLSERERVRTWETGPGSAGGGHTWRRDGP